MAKNLEKIIADLDGIKATGVSPRQILEAAKLFYKEHAEGTKDSCIPRVRTSSAFRKATELAAMKVDKTITEYIFDAVEDSNKKLEGKE